MNHSEDESTVLTNIEMAAEEVAEAKHYLVELDRRQNQLREAKRAIMKMQEPRREELYLLCSGSTFVSCELDKNDTITYLSWKMQQGESDIEAAREDLKEKVAALARLEGPDSALATLYQGFDLKPV